jgi:hypothetical protein
MVQKSGAGADSRDLGAWGHLSPLGNYLSRATLRWIPSTIFSNSRSSEPPIPTAKKAWHLRSDRNPGIGGFGLGSSYHKPISLHISENMPVRIEAVDTGFCPSQNTNFIERMAGVAV